MDEKKKLKKLVKKAMRGEAAAFEQLVRQFSSQILFLASQKLDNASEVEDASQEVVLALYKNIGSLRSPHAFYAYLKQIVHNVCMERNKKGKRIKTDDLDEYIERQVKQLPEELVSRDEETLGSEENDLINAGEMAAYLNKLPERQRETLYLHYHQGFSYKEIAQLQGISINTVGVNVSKAKASLRKMMEPERAQAPQVQNADERSSSSKQEGQEA